MSHASANKMPELNLSFPLVLVLSALLFYVLLLLDIPLYAKVLIILLELSLTSHIIVKMFGFNAELGVFILYRTKIGMRIISALSRYRHFWETFADIGLFIAYGFSSFYLFKQNTNKKVVAIIGIILLAFLAVFISQFSLVFMRASTSIGLEKAQQEYAGNTWLPYLMLFVIAVGGFFSVGMVGLILKSFSILYLVVSKYLLGAVSAAPSPGAAVILPGVNIPLVEGLIALLVLIIVHEGSHGVLAVMRKIKIKNTGLVLFGFLPIGAFVEPDEEEVEKKNDKEKVDIFVAGSTANFLTSVFFFLVYMLVFYLFGFPDNAGVYAYVLRFVYITLGLIVSLNFIVGTVNLLPLPVFDGYRILEVPFDKKYAAYLSWVSLAAIFIAFLPWFI